MRGSTDGLSICAAFFCEIMWRKINIAGVILAVFVIRCVAATTQHGDAKLIDRKNFSLSPVAVDELIFPDISIGETSVVRYRVRSLPQVIYPRGFYLEVPDSEDSPFRIRGGLPWRDCEIRASLVRPTGGVFFVRRINLGSGRRSSHPGKRNRRKIFFPFTDYEMEGKTSLPHYLSYDLQIEVLRPSLRASDKISVEAITLLPSTKAALRNSAGER